MKGSAGGIACGIILRQKSLEKYYANPNYCLFCGKIIPIREGVQVATEKRKKFCDYHCSGFYNNAKNAKQRKPKVEKPLVLDTITKGELFSGRGYLNAKSAIANHSESTMRRIGTSKKCIVCGYNKFVEVCHKIPVARFPGTATIAEINDVSNLVYLCRNHHWEMDHGELNIGECAL